MTRKRRDPAGIREIRQVDVEQGLKRIAGCAYDDHVGPTIALPALDGARPGLLEAVQQRPQWPRRTLTTGLVTASDRRLGDE